MIEYPRIQTVFKRDRDRHLRMWDWACLEFSYLSQNVWVFTEKVDGINIRVIFQGGRVSFAGKTDKVQLPAPQLPAPLISRLEERFSESNMRRVFGGDACLYGEGYGGNFVLFDVCVGEWWLQRADVHDIANRLGIDVVPVIGEGSLYDAVDRARKGFKSHWGDFEAEGIVARPQIELCTRTGKRIITKVKKQDFPEE